VVNPAPRVEDLVRVEAPGLVELGSTDRGAIRIVVVFSCHSRIPIEPGRWPQRSRPEALG